MKGAKFGFTNPGQQGHANLRIASTGLHVVALYTECYHFQLINVIICFLFFLLNIVLMMKKSLNLATVKDCHRNVSLEKQLDRD